MRVSFLEVQVEGGLYGLPAQLKGFINTKKLSLLRTSICQQSGTICVRETTSFSTEIDPY